MAVNCRRCGGELESPASQAIRLGRACADRALAEALACWHPWQVVKAREAVDMGAVVPLSRFGAYGVVSASGSGQIYVADAERFTCTCRAADCHLGCYHVPAALIAHLGPVPVVARAA
jgi:hypothetical protein